MAGSAVPQTGFASVIHLAGSPELGGAAAEGSLAELSAEDPRAWKGKAHLLRVAERAERVHEPG